MSGLLAIYYSHYMCVSLCSEHWQSDGFYDYINSYVHSQYSGGLPHWWMLGNPYEILVLFVRYPSPYFWPQREKHAVITLEEIVNSSVSQVHGESFVASIIISV